MTQKAVTIVSGGLDSVTLAYLMQRHGFEQTILSFDYGQKHKKELRFAVLCAQALDAKHVIVDLKLPLKSALTSDDIAVPHGHYAAENMKQTVVPNRNAIMLSIAWGIAVSDGAQVVATGVHAGDHPIYPDCREDFIASLSNALRLGTEGFRHDDLYILAPFMRRSKSDIVEEGAWLDVPFEHTWSCYEGGEVHCGKCGTCVERREAFSHAGVDDPTVYRGDDVYHQ